MAEAWETIRDGLLAAVEGRAKGFLDANKGAKAILTERASRLAKLSALYVVANADGRAVLQADLDIVRQSLENDLAALAVNASAEAHATFTNLAGAVFDGIIRSLPGIIGVL